MNKIKELKTDYQYIEMNLLSQTEKTQCWAVRNKKSQLLLGRVGWSGAWRQYIFEPWENTIFSKGCLEDICYFIKQLMDKRKK